MLLFSLFLSDTFKQLSLSLLQANVTTMIDFFVPSWLTGAILPATAGQPAQLAESAQSNIGVFEQSNIGVRASGLPAFHVSSALLLREQREGLADVALFVAAGLVAFTRVPFATATTPVSCLLLATPRFLLSSHTAEETRPFPESL